MNNKKLYPSKSFFSRLNPIKILRAHDYEEIDCPFDMPSSSGRIKQTVGLTIMNEDWPIRLSIKSDFGADMYAELFVDDDTMLAINEAYLRLRRHYAEGENGYS